MPASAEIQMLFVSTTPYSVIVIITFHLLFCVERLQIFFSNASICSSSNSACFWFSSWIMGEFCDIANDSPYSIAWFLDINELPNPAFSWSSLQYKQAFNSFIFGSPQGKAPPILPGMFYVFVVSLRFYRTLPAYNTSRHWLLYKNMFFKSKVHFSKRDYFLQQSLISMPKFQTCPVNLDFRIVENA